MKPVAAGVRLISATTKVARRGGDWFRLRTLRQGKRAEEADVVSRIVRRKLISAKNNRADFALAA